VFCLIFAVAATMIQLGFACALSLAANPLTTMHRAGTTGSGDLDWLVPVEVNGAGY
jgi:hypothetical protein